MPGNQRICSAKQAIGDRKIESYDLLDASVEENRVAIWQPQDQVHDLFEFPQPADSLQDKATSFLERAVEQEAHLGLAPEWGYNVEWVTDHEDLLFTEDGPLFVLGCAQMERTEMVRVVDELSESEGYSCIPKAVPQDNYNRYLTPTIIPLRTVSDNEGQSEDVLLIQYKNHPLGDHANPIEELELIEGEFVWKIDPEESFLELLALTCSDLLDGELRTEAEELARSPQSLVAHVQCNPRPFYGIWTRFRRRLFESESQYGTYLTANWSDIGYDDNDHTWGYSGIYTKAPMRTPLRRYDDIYKRGGLPATLPDENSEMVWSAANDDVVSLFHFSRADPMSPAAAGPSCADPYISMTWTWDGDTYARDCPGIPECDDGDCDDWVSRLPERSSDIELISSIALGEFKSDGINPRQTFTPLQHIDWSCLLNLVADSREQTNHLLVKGHHRKGRDPASMSATLETAFELADQEAGIEPVNEVDLSEFPVNADYGDPNRSVPIMLTVIDTPSDRAWRSRLEKINRWFELRQDDQMDRPPFKPVVIRMHNNGVYRFNKLNEYERVDSGSPHPERVDATGRARRTNQ